MAFKITIEVEPDGLMCGQCRFLTSAEACALFDSKPWKMRVVHTPGGPTYERLPECIEAEQAAPLEEEETYRIIRDLRWIQDRHNEECADKLRQEAAIITRRFVDAGWTEYEDRWQGAWRRATEHVAVLDLNGDPHKWQIFDLSQAKDCLKALEAAERAAKGEG